MSAASTAPQRLVVGHPSEPPRRPYGVRNVGPSDLGDLPIGSRPVDAAVSRFADAQPSQRPPKNAVVVEFVDDCFIAADLTGAVYGAGPSADEAVADFFVALDEQLSFLRAHVPELHPRLERKLAVLQRLFPDH